MSDATYCREDCRFCAYREGRWELAIALAFPVLPEVETAPVGAPIMAVMVHPATRIVACPSCGTALLPNGETAEMVRRSVAVRLAGLLHNAEDECPPQWRKCDLSEARQCDECVLAWAERQEAEA